MYCTDKFSLKCKMFRFLCKRLSFVQEIAISEQSLRLNHENDDYTRNRKFLSTFL